MPSTVHRDPGPARREIVRTLVWSALVVGAMLVAGMAAGASGKLSAAQARYEQDRAACISGQTNQDRATCLREAGAVLQEARRVGPVGNGQAQYEQNRLLRCEGLPAADREDCFRRMRGEGTVSGSAASGGIYRELRTSVPVK